MTADRADQVHAALVTALRDFQQPTPVSLRLEASVSSSDDLVWVTRPDGSRCGFWVASDASGEELLVLVADFLQEQVFDQLEEAWGEARPPCPGHQHPANPELHGGEAWWVCPRTGQRLGRIGGFDGHSHA